MVWRDIYTVILILLMCMCGASKIARADGVVCVANDFFDAYLPGGKVTAVEVVEEIAFVAVELQGLKILDVSDPSQPIVLGVFDIPGLGIFYDIEIGLDRAYMTWSHSGDGSVYILDISQLENPQLLEIVETERSPLRVYEREGLMYVTGYLSGLTVYDVQDVSNPILLGNLRVSATADSDLDGDYVSLINDDNIFIIDIKDPNDLKYIYSVQVPGSANAIWLEGDACYVATDRGLSVFDRSNPLSPFLVREILTEGRGLDIYLEGDRLYLAHSEGGLSIYDIQSPLDPLLLGLYDTPGIATGVDVEAGTAFVVDRWSGMQVINVTSPKGSPVLGSIDFSDKSVDVVSAGSYSIISLTEFAGEVGQLLFVNIADPSNPDLVHTLGAGHIGQLGSAKMQLQGNILLVAGGASGFVIYDIGKLPAIPSVVFSGSFSDVATDILMVEDRVYLTSSVFGLIVLDAANLSDPSFIGFHMTDGYAQGVEVIGATAFVADGESGIKVFDITNPSLINLVGSIDSGDARVIKVVDDVAFVIDADLGLQMFDVSDQSNPVSVELVDPVRDAMDIDIVDGRMYVACSQSGLRVYDIANPYFPILLGRHDSGQDDIAVSAYQTIACLAGFSGELQLINTSDLCAAECLGDFSGDGLLDFFDISAFLTAFGSAHSTADFSGDGVLDFFDISAFLSAYAAGCP